MRRSPVAIPRGMSTNNMRAGHRAALAKVQATAALAAVLWLRGRSAVRLSRNVRAGALQDDRPRSPPGVEPLDKPELDHAHRFRHRIDVVVVDDRHRWTLRPRWGAYVLARIPLRSARPTLTSRTPRRLPGRLGRRRPPKSSARTRRSRRVDGLTMSIMAPSADAWTSPPMMLWNVFFSGICGLPPHETGPPI